MSDDDAARWEEAALVAALIAVDPVGLNGACIRAPHGPVRDRWLDLLRSLLGPEEPMRRVPVHVADDRLLGGLDLTATLQAGRAVVQRGILAESNGGFIVLPMAERFAASTLAHVNAVLDLGEVVLERNGLALRTPAWIGVIALDEGIDEDQRMRPDLLDRLPFLLDLSTLRPTSAGGAYCDAAAVARARGVLPEVRDDAACESLCFAAMKLGVASIRPSIMALRAARALAALDGRTDVSEDDAALAARLVLAPRATVLPAKERAESEPSEPSPGDQEPADNTSAEASPPQPPPRAADASADGPEDANPPQASDALPGDLVLAAAVAAIPKGLLDRLMMGKPLSSPAGSDGRSGASRQSHLRGRPAGARRGELRAGVRLNLIETLRAAAPWQALRRARANSAGKRVQIRSEDFHVTRYRQRTQATTIFVVDASGSSALNRLAEAKGAVELLLADCYVRRDQVAVIAFRGKGAEILLPPTRSLVRAKRNLAGLPGGGGTPLAAALDAGVALAAQVRRAGQTATLVVLTDGRANIARDGSGNRERAESEARCAAQNVRASAIATLFIDISPRPQPQAESLAAVMNARYVALPHADAVMLSAAVRSATAPARR